MAAKKSSVSKIKLKGVDTLFGIEEPKQDGVQEVCLSELKPFEDHPFQVIRDEKMEELMESISEHGVLVPGLARPNTKGREAYELIAGHRRKFACQELQLATMPVLIRDLTDDEAIVAMVDSNIQREKLLYSEKAFAYRMKYEALKRQGNRSDRTLVQLGPKLEKRWAAELVGKEVGENISAIKRYIRLTYLEKELLGFVDKGTLAFTVGVELSYLKRSEQQCLLAFMNEIGMMPQGTQARKMKETSREKVLGEEEIRKIMLKPKSGFEKMNISGKKLREYFPADYSQKQIEEIIFHLLEEWKMKSGG